MPERVWVVDWFGAAKFLAFLENPNPGETEFLGFWSFWVSGFLEAVKLLGLEPLSFWVSWRIQKWLSQWGQWSRLGWWVDLGGGCVVFTKTIGVLCCCSPNRRLCYVVMAQISGGFLLLWSPDQWFSHLSLPHPHSFPLFKVDLEVFSLGFLWI